jgi:hypothetical protein
MHATQLFKQQAQEFDLESLSGKNICDKVTNHPQSGWLEESP